MVVVNLLPWREHWRRYQKRSIKKILGSVFLVITSLSIILYGTLLHQEKHARLRLAVINRELKRYAAFQARMEAKANVAELGNTVKILLDQRSEIRKFFTKLGGNYVEHVCFTEILHDQSYSIFTGYARSTMDLMQFVSTWRAAHFFSDIHIEKVEQQTNRQVRFQFRAQ